MALGLVQPPQQQGRELPATVTPKATADAFFTPKHTRKQRTISISNAYGATRPIDIRLDIVLDTPVLVLPRSSCSSQVFVVHLGKISMTNNATLEVPPSAASGGAGGEYDGSKYNDTDLKMFTIDEEMFLPPPPLETTYGDTYCSEEDLNDANFDRFGNFFGKDIDGGGQQVETYILDVRNINVYSLDTRTRKGFRL